MKIQRYADGKWNVCILWRYFALFRDHSGWVMCIPHFSVKVEILHGLATAHHESTLSLPRWSVRLRRWIPK